MFVTAGLIREEAIREPTSKIDLVTRLMSGQRRWRIVKEKISGEQGSEVEGAGWGVSRVGSGLTGGH